MSYKLHKSSMRGKTRNDWLDSAHTFSFGDFRDPLRMGFRSLRVINEDVIIPGSGFATHPHKDMEIITYVINGELAHKDSMGNGSVIKAGDLQKMSAGTGVTHSEFNPSNDNEGHFLQIWIRPEQKDLPPAYEQIAFDEQAGRERFVVVGAPEGGPGTITIHQDARLLMAAPLAETILSYEFSPNRHGFLHLITGAADIDGQHLEAGDGLEISDTTRLTLKALADSRIMLFDLA